MAERPDELNEETRDNTGTTAVAKTRDDAGDNVYLENRSTDDSTFDDSETAATPSDEITPETEQLKEQIEETRSNLGETINAIQERLSISNITEQVKDEVSDHISSALKTAKDSVYEATIGKAGTIMSYLDKGIKNMEKTNIGRAASKNPLALSLIGLGLGMLLINGYSTKKRTTYRYNDDDDREDNYNRRSFAAKGGKSTFATAQDKVGDYAGQAYEGVSNAAGAVSGKVSDYAGAVSGTVGDYAGKVSGTVSDYAGQAYEQVGNIGSKAKDFAGSAQDQYEHYMDENPLAVGAVALALGAAVGMAFPSTQVENRLMGEKREQLMSKAQETARGALDKVQEAAGNVGETVKQVAGEVAQNIQDSAGTVTDKVKEEAKNQGLTQ
ncbi:MAG: DUF3618 domain-containing protein [Acidobacteriota bacterium]|nr:DUF3618 domain-containing protein [Acidobacteriota bacterium]